MDDQSVFFETLPCHVDSTSISAKAFERLLLATPTIGRLVMGMGTVPVVSTTNQIFVHCEDSGTLLRRATTGAGRPQWDGPMLVFRRPLPGAWPHCHKGKMTRGVDLTNAHS
jgi:hypothetical protein